MDDLTTLTAEPPSLRSAPGRPRDAADGSDAVDRRHGLSDDPPIDRAKAITAVGDLLAALGRDVRGPHLRDTPRRVVDAYLELLTPRALTLTTFDNDEGYRELVLVRDIPFHSLCEHHLLPFTGVAHVAYLPGASLVGLSKLARVVQHFARDLQVQERLTQQVADFLDERLDPRGVGVVLAAEHECMSLRGVGVRGTRTVTSALHGVLQQDPRRSEFLGICLGTAGSVPVRAGEGGRGWQS
ncbi:GTP cyclohydrolase I [Occultella glacieicola]|uniref:GTP cyclohydrolase 1 n=1 Tax=Occultella glacieicola TaxID=2518684 RepID=A0ABY2E3M0_9MICO|nr:GTP cyclohydrolase I [Occultella glacieicola]TDE94007.1 GTP cyclohydrolase I [Occultella glacieicola]